MRRISKGLLHHLVVVSLCCSCAVALAVPKAAEHEDEAVTFGEAGSPPKPTAKHAAPPVAKAASGTAQTAGKPARHAKTQESRRSAGKAGSVSKGHQGSKPATATKQQQPSAKPKAASSAKTPKTTPAKKAPEKARSSGTARKK